MPAAQIGSAACKKLGINPLTARGKWQEGFSGSGAGGVDFAEVEVDTETGFIRVKKIVAVHDCGLIVNPLTTTSQINGGILMAIGYALYEERIMDRQTGLLLNTSFDSYKITNIADCPDIEVVLINMPERGVIGIGEPAVIPACRRHRQCRRQRHRRARPQPAHHSRQSPRRPRQSPQRHPRMNRLVKICHSEPVEVSVRPSRQRPFKNLPS